MTFTDRSNFPVEINPETVRGLHEVYMDGKIHTVIQYERRIPGDNQGSVQSMIVKEPIDEVRERLGQ